MSGLAGRSVVVTRAKAQAGALTAALAARGATVIEVPVLAFAPPADGGAALAAAVRELDQFAWVVLTSPNGVDAFVAALAVSGVTWGAPSRVDGPGAPEASFVPALAVVGPASAARAAEHGIAVALVPERFVAEGLVEAFADAPRRGRRRVLVAQAEAARDVVAAGLAARGWDVTAVVAYRSVAAPVDPDALDRARAADAIAFTSGSTVANYVAVAGRAAIPRVVACIGPVTADVARAHGLPVDVVADPYTIDGLVDALSTHLAAEPSRDRP